MATLTEILILHGLLPIEYLDTLMAGNPADEGAVRALVEGGVISGVQFAQARPRARRQTTNCGSMRPTTRSNSRSRRCREPLRSASPDR